MRCCRPRPRWRADRRRPAVASRLHLRPAWRGHGRPGRRRPPARTSSSRRRCKTLEPFKDSLVVVSNLQRAGGQAEMHAAAASGWLSGAIPKRTEAEDFACRHDDRSGARATDRTVVAVSLARVRDRGLHRLRRRLHARLQLRVSRLNRVGLAHDAAADGDQPARRIRAAVRRRRIRGRAPAQPARGSEHPRRRR